MGGFFYHVLALNISLTPLIAALLILMPLFKMRYSAYFRYWMWLVISLRLLVPVSFGAYSPFLLNFPVHTDLPEAISQSPIFQNSDFTGAAVASALFSGLTFGKIITVMYFTGVIAFLAYKFASYTLFLRSVKRWSREPVDAGIAGIVAELSPAYGLNADKNRLKIRRCKKIAGPMVIGLFRPTLLLPDDEYDPVKLRMVLSHEIVHLKRHDLWYKLVLLFVCALHWFNPVVQIMAKRADNDLEISCDNIVLKSADINEKKLYSKMIIEMAANNLRSAPPALSTNFKSGKDSLGNRIKGIFDSGIKKSGTAALIIIVFALAVMGEFVHIKNIPASLTGINQQVQAGQEIRPQINKAADSNKESLDYGTGLDYGIKEPQTAPTADNAGLPDMNTQGGASKPASLPSQPARPAQSATEVVIIDLNQLSPEDD